MTKKRAPEVGQPRAVELTGFSPTAEYTAKLLAQMSPEERAALEATRDRERQAEEDRLAAMPPDERARILEARESLQRDLRNHIERQEARRPITLLNEITFEGQPDEAKAACAALLAKRDAGRLRGKPRSDG